MHTSINYNVLLLQWPFCYLSGFVSILQETNVPQTTQIVLDHRPKIAAITGKQAIRI
jgi:hypothetical protein